jgi:hypothetical protein
MSDGEELAGCIGGLLAAVMVIAAVILAVMTILSIGSLYGAGVAIYNYFQAFRNNVSPKEVPV